MTATPSAAETRTTETSATGPGGTRFGGLDGLRAIAVLLVIVYHLGSGILPGGFIGVDIFFVISGFLITALLLRERERTGSLHLGRFWVRRARRLLPAIALLVIVCCTAAWVIGGDVLVGLGLQALGAATFSSNWIAIAAGQSYFDESTPELLRNLWSLAVEEQFYLVWPLLLLLIVLLPRRWMRVGVMLAAASASAVAMAVLVVPGDATRVYFGTDTHSFGLALGAALAFGSVSISSAPDGGRVRLARMVQASGWAAVAGLLVASILLHDDATATYIVGLPLVAVLTALAIFAAVQPGSRLARVLDARPMAWVGERSYGLYLWHWPVFVLTVAATSGASPAARWLVAGVALAITVVAAQFSYVVVEQPIRQLGFRGALASAWRGITRAAGRRRLGRIAMASASVIAVVGLVGGTVGAIASDPGTGSVQQQIESGRDAIEDAAAPPSAEPEALDAEPEPPAIPGGDQITAIGDSVMLASAVSLQGVFPGIDIDAAVSRQFSSAPTLIQARIDAGTLRPIVLLGLGTNGPVDQETLAEVRELLGTEHQLVLVNVYAPRHWTEGVNVTLTSFAQQYRDVELANWRDSISPQLPLLARDQIHPGDAGGLVYAAAVQDALQRLAELPPVVGPRDYGLAPQPT